jgi:hypothetical protein
VVVDGCAAGRASLDDDARVCTASAISASSSSPWAASNDDDDNLDPSVHHSLALSFPITNTATRAQAAREKDNLIDTTLHFDHFRSDVVASGRRIVHWQRQGVPTRTGPTPRFPLDVLDDIVVVGCAHISNRFVRMVSGHSSLFRVHSRFWLGRSHGATRRGTRADSFLAQVSTARSLCSRSASKKHASLVPSQ